MKNEFKINAKAGGAAEVLVYGPIGDDWGGVSAKTFAAQLTEIGNVKRIDVRINSAGGSAVDGFAMMAQLARHPAKVDTYIDGWALSAASVLAMAGENIIASDHAMMMIHNSWSMAIGDAAQMTKMADFLTMTDGQIAGVYAKRTGKSEDDIRALMTAETWYTAAEAHAVGFVTSVIQSDSMAPAACFADDPLAQRVLRNAPAGLLERLPKRPEGCCRNEYVLVRKRAIDTLLSIS